MCVRPARSYLCLKTLDQDGHQQVEEDVVPEGHQRNEVEGGYGRGGSHAVIQYLVPVFLGQNLKERRGKGIKAKMYLIKVKLGLEV